MKLHEWQGKMLKAKEDEIAIKAAKKEIERLRYVRAVMVARALKARKHKKAVRPTLATVDTINANLHKMGA